MKFKAIYAQKEGRDLSYSEIATWYMEFLRLKNSTEDKSLTERMNPELKNAITAYQGQKIMDAERTKMERLIDVALGAEASPHGQERERATELLGILETRLGYNGKAAFEALQIIRSIQANRPEKQEEGQ